MFPITCNAVGDLFALAQLASQIAQALYDSKNAPQEYQELKEEIGIFQIGVMDACKFLEPEFPIKLEPIAEMIHSTKLVQFRQEELRKGMATIQDQVGQLLIRQPVKELGYGWCDVKAVRLLDAFATRIEVLANFCSSYSVYPILFTAFSQAWV
ncbi:hypothetical protein RUND412_001962 [Rhizina undulata]